jgi:hypothetical protein
MTRTYLLVLGWLMLAGGCSPYVDDYQFQPRPALAEVRSGTTQNALAPVTALASVIGVRYADQKEGLPDCVEIRVRLEATGSESVTFDPRTLELTNGTLLIFPTPIIKPAAPITLGPTQSAVVTGYFPFPTGYTYITSDLATLQLRWLVQVNGQTVRQLAYFSRVVPAYYYYYDPYYADPPYPYAGGFYREGYYHQHR